MNEFLNALEKENNFTYTENGAVTHKSTSSMLYDMFALGAAYRTRSTEDKILLFKNAYEENPTYALKCLFYLRDVRGGQGERQFFRDCLRYLADNDSNAVIRNIKNIPEFGRWDDLYALVGTKCNNEALEFIKEQFYLDKECNTPSLLGKWMKSENASSKETRRLAKITREYLGLTSVQYRKSLSSLREKINVLERLMSANKWDEIEFDKIPSRAGLIYRNAFAKHDIDRVKAEKQSYADFAKSDASVNAKDLYPYEVVEEAIKATGSNCWYRNSYSIDETERLMLNKYWDNLTDYFNNCTFNGLAVVDTSSSMHGTPINVAISLGLYCAERSNGAFKDHYISFSSRPQLIKTEGIDFVDKVYRIYKTNLCENTDIEATFDMLLNTAIDNHIKQEDLPSNIIVISDMEFDSARGCYYNRSNATKTLMENISDKWEENGYKMPNLIFWNVNARNNNIPMECRDGVTFVSGFSPVIFQMVMSGKTGYDLMMDKLDSDRYSVIK